MKRAQHKKVQHEESTTRKKCNMKTVKHKQRLGTELTLEKKCKRRVHYSA